MLYKGEELSNYPICDTDIWVNIILAKLDDALIEKYEKIVVADVVEKEILQFSKNEYRQLIIDNRAFMNEGTRIYKENKNAIVAEAEVQNLLLKLRGKL